VICSAPVLEVAPAILPPKPVVRILNFLAPYYPRARMPAVDTASTYDEAFGDPEWAALTRRDPKVQVSLTPTLAVAAAAMTTGEKIAARARDFALPLLAIHATKDCRANCGPVQEFVDRVGSSRAEGFWLEDTSGHQLLQDSPEVTQRVMDKIADWMNRQVSSTGS